MYFSLRKHSASRVRKIKRTTVFYNRFSMEKKEQNNILTVTLLMDRKTDILTARLLESGIENARNEVRWMMEGANDALLSERVERRIKGEPLQYILGNVPFHCVELLIGPGVLIPRPETEQLVEIALSCRKVQGKICDLCTGSGAIALAMAKTLPEVRFTGVDLSADALSWAIRNKELNSADNVEFLLGDLYAPLPGGERFAMITANPPYVSPEEYRDLDRTVRDYEPRMALEAADNGLETIRRIAAGAEKHLEKGGMVIMEIGESQGQAVNEIFAAAGMRATIRSDYAGRDRFVLAEIGDLS